MTTKTIIVLTDWGLKNIDTVKSDIKNTGFEITKVYALTGVIQGSLDKASISSVKEIKGVESVSGDLTTTL